LADVAAWLSASRLRLNPSKTVVILPHSGRLQIQDVTLATWNSVLSKSSANWTSRPLTERWHWHIQLHALMRQTFWGQTTTDIDFSSSTLGTCVSRSLFVKWVSWYKHRKDNTTAIIETHKCEIWTSISHESRSISISNCNLQWLRYITSD